MPPNTFSTRAGTRQNAVVFLRGLRGLRAKAAKLPSRTPAPKVSWRRWLAPGPPRGAGHGGALRLLPGRWASGRPCSVRLSPSPACPVSDSLLVRAVPSFCLGRSALSSPSCPSLFPFFSLKALRPRAVSHASLNPGPLGGITGSFSNSRERVCTLASPLRGRNVSHVLASEILSFVWTFPGPHPATFSAPLSSLPRAHRSPQPGFLLTENVNLVTKPALRS